MCQLFRIGLRYGTSTIAFAMAPQCKLNFGLFFLIAPYKAEEKCYFHLKINIIILTRIHI